MGVPSHLLELPRSPALCHLLLCGFLVFVGSLSSPDLKAITSPPSLFSVLTVMLIWNLLYIDTLLFTFQLT